jgi:dTDP-4-amino-4,6-dideoxygalactose transaminase
MSNHPFTVPMLDLGKQYLRFKDEIDDAVRKVFISAAFINGAPVKKFCERLSAFLNVPFVIPCGNATDALRIALQTLETGAGDEVIAPAFTYIAPVEAVASLGAMPVPVDVDPRTFNIDPSLIEQAITNRTKAIIVVHLFGHSCDMEPIMNIARKYNLKVIEDNAQSLGSIYYCDCNSENNGKMPGTIGDIGITSFFPTKPLACYGDGGALFTSDEHLAHKLRALANHGQDKVKYHHSVVGCNSRLDTVQAAILNIKLNHFDELTSRRTEIAGIYDNGLNDLPGIILPSGMDYSTHVYHQYTIRVLNGRRDELKSFLAENGIQSIIYYPVPVHEQDAYKWISRLPDTPKIACSLCKEVLSIPVCPEMSTKDADYVISCIKKFFT